MNFLIKQNIKYSCYPQCNQPKSYQLCFLFYQIHFNIIYLNHMPGEKHVITYLPNYKIMGHNRETRIILRLTLPVWCLLRTLLLPSQEHGVHSPCLYLSCAHWEYPKLICLKTSKIKRIFWSQVAQQTLSTS